MNYLGYLKKYTCPYSAEWQVDVAIKFANDCIEPNRDGSYENYIKLSDMMTKSIKTKDCDPNELRDIASRISPGSYHMPQLYYGIRAVSTNYKSQK